MDKPKLSVILLSYGSWELVHARLAELYKYFPYEQELVWIDNGTQEEDALSGMDWWKGVLPKKFQFKFYRFSENQGFGVGNNRGAELATSDNLMFISSDVIIRKPFMDMILSSLAEAPNSLWGDRIIWWDGGWNSIPSSKGTKYIVPYAEGYLLASTKKVWKELGGFDPIFSPADCEDLDLSVTAALTNHPVQQLEQGYFSHIGGGTASRVFVDRMSLTVRNKEKLDEKWKDRIELIGEKLNEKKN